MKTLVVCSGGLDSVTLAYKVARDHTLSGLVTFDYGQRHKKEIDFAKQCAQKLQTAHFVIDISSVGAHLGGSSLTDDLEVPDGHYAQDSMKLTVVPNRNAMMLTIAYGIAAAQKLDAVATAVHGGDHYIYPDCRPAFIQSFQDMQNLALKGLANIKLYTPYLDGSKKDIALDAKSLGVDIQTTWSCYKGQDLHCGRCGTCVERIEALSLAGVSDTTIYDDPHYWKQAITKTKKESHQNHV